MTITRGERLSRKRRHTNIHLAATALLIIISCSGPSTSEAFSTPNLHSVIQADNVRLDLQLSAMRKHSSDTPLREIVTNIISSAAATASLSAALILGTTASPAFAENELQAKYGGGFDASLVDQTCLVDKCSVQAKACLADDPSCRKGLTCTAKCLGDAQCINGCMAQYGNSNLDNMLKCTIEDNNCIKVAILDGGADKLGEEPRPPAPTIRNFNMNSMEGQWYKVVGFNPNYDCYACQRNSFSAPEKGKIDGNFFGSGNDRLKMDVEFSLMKMMPDGTPPPPTNEKESVKRSDDGLMYGSRPIGFNDYTTQEIMVFDNAQDAKSQFTNLVLGKGTDQEISYQRTAHSEGEMFGLKFWENWYVLGENDPNDPEFKFIYYNGKTRQNTYEGAFVYSRTKEIGPAAMKKVYKIASDAGMNPDQFCKIRNSCFSDEEPVSSSSNPFRGIIASTKVSQLLGVEPVAGFETSERLFKAAQPPFVKRHWWQEAGDYLEDPNRHFRAMDSLRETMEWPESIKEQN